MSRERIHQKSTARSARLHKAAAVVKKWLSIRTVAAAATVD